MSICPILYKSPFIPTWWFSLSTFLDSSTTHYEFGLVVDQLRTKEGLLDALHGLSCYGINSSTWLDWETNKRFNCTSSFDIRIAGPWIRFFCAKLENSKSLIGELGYLGEKSLIENLEAYRTGSLGEYLSDKFIQQCKGASLGAFNSRK